MFDVDDWVWVFADDRMVFSGHSCSAAQLLEALNYDDYESLERDYDRPEEDYWLANEYASLSDFPQHLFS